VSSSPPPRRCAPRESTGHLDFRVEEQISGPARFLSQPATFVVSVTSFMQPTNMFSSAPSTQRLNSSTTEQSPSQVFNDRTITVSSLQRPNNQRLKFSNDRAPNVSSFQRPEPPTSQVLNVPSNHRSKFSTSRAINVSSFQRPEQPPFQVSNVQSIQRLKSSTSRATTVPSFQRPEPSTSQVFNVPSNHRSKFPKHQITTASLSTGGPATGRKSLR
jgi:hypothetical protein